MPEAAAIRWVADRADPGCFRWPAGAPAEVRSGLHQCGGVVNHHADQGHFGVLGCMGGVPPGDQDAAVVGATPGCVDEPGDHRMVGDLWSPVADGPGLRHRRADGLTNGAWGGRHAAPGVPVPLSPLTTGTRQNLPPRHYRFPTRCSRALS
jgi:hypothetical protein